jgi:Icc-related predicted phosphoesterase
MKKPIKFKYSSQISLQDTIKRNLEKRREELFVHYREICGSREIRNIVTGKTEKINIEDDKRRWDYPPLSSILPKQKIIFRHTLPLKILAFSDYRVHDFKPLLEYVKKLKEKPDIIVYAGDDIERFGPLPLNHLTFEHFNGNHKHPPMLESVRISYENGFISSPSFGFILRFPKKLRTDIKNKIKQVRDSIYSKIQTFNKSNLRHLQMLKNLVQELPVQIEIITIKDKSASDEKIISLIDVQTQLEIYRFKMSRGELRPELLSNYDAFFLVYKDVDLDKLRFIRVKSDKNYVYYLIPNPDQPEKNFFEELAKYARYGVVAILGNDEEKIARAWIQGKKVYELFTSLVKIGPVIIVGLEGSTCGMGPNGKYLESDIKLRLEYVQKKVAKDELILIVSHTPPRGILDRAIRFGEESIGSIALRDFIEEESRVGLVICGHVHSCGGSFETLNNAMIANVSSHDDPFSRANIAWITINKEKKVQINIENLPSLVEQIISENGQDVKEKLKSKCHLSDTEARLFISYAKRNGIAFFDYLPKIAKIKFRYGLPWNLVLMLYERGVKDLTQLNEQIFIDIYPETFGIYRVHWKKAYAKFKREKSNGIYLINPLPITGSRIVVFDTEYNSEMGILYGFLDLFEKEIKHFWFDEKREASEFVRSKIKQNYIFVHWGGADKTLLLKELEVNPQTFNLLYFCQTSLVAPLNSTILKDVHDALCGHVREEWWETNFYSISGFDKLILCNILVRNPADVSSRRALLEANKADILALEKVLKVLDSLPVKSSEAVLDQLTHN